MILITGGGTGGHLAIAKALCEAYNELEIRPFYIGSTYGQDKDWFEKYPGFKKTIFLPTTGVVNRRGLRRISALANILKQAFMCKSFLKTHEIKSVISVGGYAAAPAALAALMVGIPLYIHEQNAKKGRLNQILKPFAKEFFSSYEKKSPVHNYPVSKRFFKAYRHRKSVQTILFLGGSQGASAINELALSLALWLHENGIHIIHQCGKHDEKKVLNFYKKHKIPAQVFAFSEHIDSFMYQSDIAISRSGAGSVWELCAAGLPTLFIPYPHAARNHQYENAKALEEECLTAIIKQDELNMDEVKKWIKSVDVAKISTALHKRISPGGAKAIIKRIESGRK